MPTLEDFFADLARLREGIRSSDRQNAPNFSVFRYPECDENLLSDIIADLLDPRGPHGQGTLFLEQFFRAAGVDLGVPLEGARVRREVTTTFLAQSRRIDVTVEVGRFGIGVENKPWAGDLPEQVADYVRDLAGKYGEGRYFMVYLSGGGRHPSSLPEPERDRLQEQGRFRTLPYAGAGACGGGCRAARRRAAPRRCGRSWAISSTSSTGGSGRAVGKARGRPWKQTSS
jgi:hypothetical protein